ncbi:LysR family transcriptional regulator [Aeromicrobium sp. CF4.19]|uniref:LysR family transcriptional regulator n=1 Tax=Aeromicrobium sp. CF4.19 TaxID=3373082 RepID=UPI003EE74D9F
MPDQPDLDDLAILVLVAHRGSIGRAAAELQLSQPSVSRRMGALERRLGVQVLHRSRRGTSLTPEGQVVVDWASGLLAAAEQFVHSVESLRGHRLSVEVAVSMTIAEHFAPSWLAALRSRRPGVSISLIVLNSTHVAEQVDRGAVALGFVEAPSVRESLGRRRVGWDDLVVAVPPSHPWAGRGDPVTLAEAAGRRLAVREPGSGTRETIDRAFDQAGLTFEPAVEMPSNTALASAALAGLGAVVLSELALAGPLGDGRLVRVPLEASLRRPLAAIWRRDEAPSGVLADLVDVAVGTQRERRRDEVDHT